MKDLDWKEILKNAREDHYKENRNLSLNPSDDHDCIFWVFDPSHYKQILEQCNGDICNKVKVKLKD